MDTEDNDQLITDSVVDEVKQLLQSGTEVRRVNSQLSEVDETKCMQTP